MKHIHYLWVFVTLLFLGCQEEPKPEPAQAPDGLTYAPNTLQLVQGTAGNSVTPTITGTAPITYTLASSPAQSGITVNAQGVIQVANNVAVGVYNISVTATNEGGSKTFNNVYTVTVTAPVLPASNLAYSPNTLTRTEGTAGSSVMPTISGTAPFTFQVSSSPTSSAISINSQGVIQLATNATAGTYNVSVSATNGAGTVNFSNVYTITVNVTQTAPTGLTYSINTLSLLNGVAGTSVIPTVQGTQPITFSIVSVNPTNSAITIDAQGRIQVANNSDLGTFQVSVKATNNIGNTTFNNIYTVTVRMPVTYNNDISPLLTSRCGGCHSSGTNNWTLYTNTKNKITSILDRIQRPQGAVGFMPQGGTPLTLQEINLIKQWQTDGLKE
jgi:hypothetical protein